MDEPPSSAHSRPPSSHTVAAAHHPAYDRGMEDVCVIPPLLAPEMDFGGRARHEAAASSGRVLGAVADHYGRRPAAAAITRLPSRRRRRRAGGLMSRILFGVGVGGFLPVSTTMLVGTAHHNIVAVCLFTLGVLPPLAHPADARLALARRCAGAPALARPASSSAHPAAMPSLSHPISARSRCSRLLRLLLLLGRRRGSRRAAATRRRGGSRILRTAAAERARRRRPEAGAAGRSPKAGKAPEKAAAAPGAAAPRRARGEATSSRGACARRRMVRRPVPPRPRLRRRRGSLSRAKR